MPLLRNKFRACKAQTGAMEGDGGTEVRMKVREVATFLRALLHPT